MLTVSDLHSGYGGLTVLHGISLSVQKGELVSLIGSNGAGKTTLLRSIMGQVRPSHGTVNLAGQPMTGLAVPKVVQQGLVMVPEGRRVFTQLTVLENLRMGAYTSGAAAQELEYIFGLFPRLKERLTQLAGTLSGGEQQMLAIGRALMAKPKVLLLDEPSMGLAPLVVQAIFRILRQLKETGITMLLVEQNARMALGLADRGLVMESGRIVAEDTGAALLASNKVAEAYLGA